MESRHRNLAPSLPLVSSSHQVGFYTAQMKTTRNVSTDPATTWFTGGLNFQARSLQFVLHVAIALCRSATAEQAMAAGHCSSRHRQVAALWQPNPWDSTECGPHSRKRRSLASRSHPPPPANSNSLATTASALRLVQIEHHLFPRLPRHSYGAVAPRVRALCAEHGVAYEELSLLASTALILRHLQALGQPKLA